MTAQAALRKNKPTALDLLRALEIKVLWLAARMGAVFGHRLHPLAVEHFGQSGDSPDLYRHDRLNVEAILDAVASACLRKSR